MNPCKNCKKYQHETQTYRFERTLPLYTIPNPVTCANKGSQCPYELEVLLSLQGLNKIVLKAWYGVRALNEYLVPPVLFVLLVAIFTLFVLGIDAILLPVLKRELEVACAVTVVIVCAASLIIGRKLR
jgi:hypothetical protein